MSSNSQKLSAADIQYLLRLVMSDQSEKDAAEKLRIMNALNAKVEKKKEKSTKKAEDIKEKPKTDGKKPIFVPISDKPVVIPKKFIEKHLQGLNLEEAIQKIVSLVLNGKPFTMNPVHLTTEKGFFDLQKRIADLAFVTEKGGKSSPQEFKLVGEYLRQFARAIGVTPYVFTGKPQTTPSETEKVADWAAEEVNSTSSEPPAPAADSAEITPL